MNHILYFFITHKKNLEKVYQEKKKYFYFSIVVCGGNETNYYAEKNILFIDCNDLYEGLPEKIIKTLKFLVESEYFKNFTHFVKLDENIEIKNLLPYYQIKNLNYAGNVQNIEGNRKWHFNKCSSNSKFYNKEYTGIYVPWCKGGYGYIISRATINLIKDSSDYHNHIYEDLYLAIILKNKGITAINFNTDYYFIY
jgi:hypothetical protein